MKWITTSNKYGLLFKYGQWHVWFAWYPVIITDGVSKIWLQRVWRRTVPNDRNWVDWEYSLEPPKEQVLKMKGLRHK